MIFLASVTHDIRSNTLEATWLEETETAFLRHRVQNYSSEQKAEFLADTEGLGQPYADLAGW